TGPPTEQNPYPLRRFDPTCRLRGWHEMGREVDRVRAQLAAEGIDPVLAGCTWTLPGELGFYCAGHPQAYSLGLVTGDRHSQYDWWPNPLEQADDFRGRTFILVGDPDRRILDGFDRTEPPQLVSHSEGGHPVSSWVVTVCHGY